METVYKNIKRLRAEKGLTQKELADMVGYSANTMIAHIEQGTVDLPLSKIYKFAEVFGVSVQELLGYPSPEIMEKMTLLGEDGKRFISEFLEFLQAKYEGSSPIK
ncbi:MAG: helix-turn-helix transcriptional regulator [Butyrivibrio sp.]|nr:helix-turn-helix transcriptional regulator [Butyrivibrio sp.]MBP3240169.1 helix-turn-helix transcriptional regulator [Oribacterium sp.]